MVGFRSSRHRSWMGFGSALLNWRSTTPQTRRHWLREPLRSGARLAQIEGALGEGEFFAEDTFSIVDAVFGPVFR